MPWAPPYLEVAAVKAVLDVPDATEDAELEAAIAAASRAIDAYCGRQFGQADEPVARIYPATETAASRTGITIDDLMTTEALEIDVDEADDGAFSTAFALDTAARLWPWNAAADGRPWTELRVIGSSRFPRRARAVRITAQWGWTEIPELVKRACLLQTIRLFKRPDAPFGVAGSPEIGGEPLRLLARLDPDVELLLVGLRRRWYVA